MEGEKGSNHSPTTHLYPPPFFEVGTIAGGYSKDPSEGTAKRLRSGPSSNRIREGNLKPTPERFDVSFTKRD
ncbi:hypothetical protein U1Q18_025383, partial [Sarracenia purpurea var. burkii]